MMKLPFLPRHLNGTFVLVFGTSQRPLPLKLRGSCGGFGLVLSPRAEAKGVPSKLARSVSAVSFIAGSVRATEIAGCAVASERWAAPESA